MNKILLLAMVFLITGKSYSQDLVPEISQSPTIDGLANELVWDNSEWINLSYLFVDAQSGNQNTPPVATDFSGKYKVAWKENKLFFLVEVIDDQLVYNTDASSQTPGQVFSQDNVEIFLDENNSGGAHTKTHNAFAFHISPNGNVADQCGCGNEGDYYGNAGDWNGRFFNNVVESAWTQNGSTYTWEIAVTVYTDQYSDGASDNSAAMADLHAGKIMGYGVAYNDHDGPERDHMMGGFYIPGDNNGTYGTPGGRNVAWQDASVFGELQLQTITGFNSRRNENFNIYYSSQSETIFINTESHLGEAYVYSVDGVLVKTVFLERGVTEVTGLSNGLYIVRLPEESVKLMVY